MCVEPGAPASFMGRGGGEQRVGDTSLVLCCAQTLCRQFISIHLQMLDKVRRAGVSEVVLLRRWLFCSPE